MIDILLPVYVLIIYFIIAYTQIKLKDKKLMNELDILCKETEYDAKVTKVKNFDTKEWSFISAIKVRDSLVQEYKDKGKLEELQNHLIDSITKEVKEKLV